MSTRRGRPPLNHSFSIADAEEHGVDAAIFLNHLRHFLTQHAANRRHIHDGEVWNYNSTRALEDIFPYWSRRQMQRIIKALIDAGAVKTANHNARKNDRTLWYTIPGFLAEFETGDEENETEIPIAPNGAVHCTESCNALHQTVQPLPESEPVNTTVPPPEGSPANPEGLAIQAWNDLAERCDLQKVQKVDQRRRTAVRARLKECGGLEGWQAAIAKIEASDFLRGENDRGFRATFDWVTKPANFTKLMEGNYDNRAKSSRNGKEAMFEGLRRAAMEREARPPADHPFSPSYSAAAEMRMREEAA